MFVTGPGLTQGFLGWLVKFCLLACVVITKVLALNNSLAENDIKKRKTERKKGKKRKAIADPCPQEDGRNCEQVCSVYSITKGLN